MAGREDEKGQGGRWHPLQRGIPDFESEVP